MGPCEPKKVPTEPGIPPPDLSRTVELQMVLQRSKLLQVDTGTEVERAIKGERERERKERKTDSRTMEESCTGRKGITCTNPCSVPRN